MHSSCRRKHKPSELVQVRTPVRGYLPLSKYTIPLHDEQTCHGRGVSKVHPPPRSTPLYSFPSSQCLLVPLSLALDPHRRYCQMNSWSIANHCAYPDEYDAETKQANEDREASAAERGGGSSGGGLLARGAGGGKKANGRLSYREMLFNNDGKLRPPYSAGPCASTSAGYLFPKPGDASLSR